MSSKFIRVKIILALAGFCILQLVSCFNNGIGYSKNSVVKSRTDDPIKITWQKSVKEKVNTIISGSFMSSFGRIEFRWVIKPDGLSKLVTLQPAGSAELPLIEKRILPLVLPEGKTLLFQDWSPLLYEKKPYTIRIITRVSTSDLYSVFTDVKFPPSCAISKTSNEIKWGVVYTKNGIKYLEGKTRASFGSLNLLWRKSGSGISKLVVVESPGAGGLPSVEATLLPWIDENSGLTFICQERFPLLNQGKSSYLWWITTVKTDEFLLGYHLINSDSTGKK